MVELSITIVAYNNYIDIKNAINTIEKYTTVSKKIFIVDNGKNVVSSEELIEFKKFLSKYKDVEYIECEKNLGFGGGHNKVIDLLKSKYHAIVNPDIIIEEDVFFSIIKYLEKNSEVGMVIPKISNEFGELQKVYREEVTVLDMFIRMFANKFFKTRQLKHTLQQKDYSKPFQVPFGQGSFLVIRTELFKNLSGFDEGFFMYLEDADLCKRVNNVSKLMYFPDATVIHKWEKGSHKNLLLFKYHVKSMLYYFKKWGWKLW